MKFKKTPAFEILDGAFAVKTKLRTPKTQISIYFQTDERRGEGRKKRTSNLKKRTKKQNIQRELFKYCDCLYNYLKRNWDMLREWKEETAKGEWEKKSIRSFFMHRCLKKYLPVLLGDYLGLWIDTLNVEEKEDEVIITVIVTENTMLIAEQEDIYLPNPYRQVR